MGNICNKKTLNDVDKALYKNSLDKNQNKIKQKYSNDFFRTEKDQIIINSHDFNLIKKLGKGSFGTVYLVEHKTSKILYAMKILDKGQIKENDLIENSKIERIILSRFNYPFIVDLIYSFQSNSKLFLVTEYISGGDMYLLLKKLKRLSKRMIKIYISEIILCLGYLHENKCIYRDLKPENILIGLDGHIKIIDFNLSKLFFNTKSIIDNRAESICGTADYMAPEIILQPEYDYLVDWYSLGVITYTFFTGHTPFDCKRNPKNIEAKKKPINFNSSVFDGASIDFITGLVSFDPKTRLGSNGIDEIKNHQFLQDIDFKKIYEKDYIIDPEYLPNKEKLDKSLSLINNTEKKININDDSNLPQNPETYIIKGNTYEGFTYVKDHEGI